MYSDRLPLRQIPEIERRITDGLKINKKNSLKTNKVTTYKISDNSVLRY
jgi:hypothetical protein